VRPFDPSSDPAAEPDETADGPATNPAGICRGAGLIVVHGNPAFKRVFGEGSVGLPAREGMLGLSRTGFTLMDAVIRQGRPLARWVRLAGETWRMTAAHGSTRAPAKSTASRSTCSLVIPSRPSPLADQERAGPGACRPASSAAEVE